jgi:hypothetical protein
MENLVLSLFGIWVFGLIPAILIIRYRAGLGLWDRVRVTGAGGVGVGPMFLMVGKSMAWPVTLIYWLMNDRPEPAITYERLD